jgi:hypothetical protein
MESLEHPREGGQEPASGASKSPIPTPRSQCSGYIPSPLRYADSSDSSRIGTGSRPGTAVSFDPASGIPSPAVSTRQRGRFINFVRRTRSRGSLLSQEALPRDESLETKRPSRFRSLSFSNMTDGNISTLLRRKRSNTTSDASHEPATPPTATRVAPHSAPLSPNESMPTSSATSPASSIRKGLSQILRPRAFPSIHSSAIHSTATTSLAGPMPRPRLRTLSAEPWPATAIPSDPNRPEALLSLPRKTRDRRSLSAPPPLNDLASVQVERVLPLDLFDLLLPRELRIHIFATFVLLFVEPKERERDKEKKPLAQDGRWLGWVGGVRELVKLGRVGTSSGGRICAPHVS